MTVYTMADVLSVILEQWCDPLATSINKTSGLGDASFLLRKVEARKFILDFIERPLTDLDTVDLQVRAAALTILNNIGRAIANDANSAVPLPQGSIPVVLARALVRQSILSQEAAARPAS